MTDPLSCSWCDAPVTGPPVRDGAEASWLRDAAAVYCRAECLHAAHEVAVEAEAST